MGITARNLHPGFAITRDEYWWWNRRRDETRDREQNLKVLFLFNDPSLLGETPLLAKIGPNRVQDSVYHYTGVIYGRGDDRAELEQWGSRFPSAELIVGLDNNGGMRKDAERIRLK